MTTEVPEELSYTAEHEWVAAASDDQPASTVGITAHAVSELGDIVFLELPAVGDQLEAGAACGEIESTKAVSEIYAPVAGEIVEINQAAIDAPETVGDDPYGAGWLFRIKTADGDVELLDASAYRDLIS